MVSPIGNNLLSSKFMLSIGVYFSQLVIILTVEPPNILFGMLSILYIIGTQNFKVLCSYNIYIVAVYCTINTGIIRASMCKLGHPFGVSGNGLLTSITSIFSNDSKNRISTNILVYNYVLGYL